ncbi:hypothetical protein F7725_006256 [Dissostichus mawsoni]|uniref:Uncharacterized protein n=1 Tax=Dissostichus mawsoni TaxID=36200 RepID=A0A7J5YVP7_DISMA|nr:hypothetical protein F7725_006256 [Dissostichus mawsoni]
MTSVPQRALLSKLKITRWLWGSMCPLQLGSLRCKVEKWMPLSSSRHPARTTEAESCLQTIHGHTCSDRIRWSRRGTSVRRRSLKAAMRLKLALPSGSIRLSTVD